MNDLTIAIITKNRPKQLRQCLNLLNIQARAQSPIPTIIIDNSDNAPTPLSSYSHLVILCQANNGSVPAARNQALNLVKTPWLAFLDDDCLPTRNWLQQASKNIQKYHNHPYLIGKNLLSNPNSFWANIQYYRHAYWQSKQLKSNHETIGFHLDTKNCLLNIRLLNQHHLRFDESLQIKGYDNADTDLGFQFDNLNLPGKYIPSLIVHHPETEILNSTCRKAKLRGQLSALLASKWRLQSNFIDTTKIYWPHLDDYIRYRQTEFQSFKTYFQSQASHFHPLPIYLGIKWYDHWYKQGFLGQYSLHHPQS